MCRSQTMNEQNEKKSDVHACPSPAWRISRFLTLLYNLILQIWLMIDNHTSNRSPPISKMWSAFFKHLQLLEINVKVVWLTVNQFRVFLRWNLKNLSRGLHPPKSVKTRFKWSAGLNLGTFDTILSGTNHI